MACSYCFDSVLPPVVLKAIMLDAGRIKREETRQLYNNYNWLGTIVYTPFDLLRLFNSGEISGFEPEMLGENIVRYVLRFL